jgi:hypothetical protein
MSYEEEDWIDEDATAHRGPDEYKSPLRETIRPSRRKLVIRHKHPKPAIGWTLQTRPTRLLSQDMDPDGRETFRHVRNLLSEEKKQ